MIKNIFVAIFLCAIAARSFGLMSHRSQRSAETFEANVQNTVIDEAVQCIFTMEFSYFGMRDFKTCLVTQNIDNEEYILGSDINPAIELFNISNNRDVKFLPKNVGEKLPNLQQFKAEYAGLTIIRDFNLKNMQKVQFLGLYHNNIVTIEPTAFDDLISVERMHIDYNKIETLDENLFKKMVSLQYVNLNYNKIKALKPSTFEIPNGNLGYVELIENVCIDKIFSQRAFKTLESHLKENCSA